MSIWIFQRIQSVGPMLGLEFFYDKPYLLAGTGETLHPHYGKGYEDEKEVGKGK